MYQIKRCSGPCVGYIYENEYKKTVEDAIKFVSGKSRKIQKNLSEQMEKASKELDFEKAAILRDRIKSLNIIQSSKIINDMECYSSINLCLESLKQDGIPDIFVIGGRMIYDSFYPYANVLHITFVNQSDDDIDTFFPISIDEIKKTYQITKEKKLVDDCIYTKWIKK